MSLESVEFVGPMTLWAQKAAAARVVLARLGPPHRGPRPWHVQQGCPGTWEVLSFPSKHAEVTADQDQAARCRLRVGTERTRRTGGTGDRSKEGRREERQEVGVPQYERRSRGTNPRDPAEQREVPGRRHVGRNDRWGHRAPADLTETRTYSETGTRPSRSEPPS